MHMWREEGAQRCGTQAWGQAGCLRGGAGRHGAQGAQQGPLRSLCPFSSVSPRLH